MTKKAREQGEEHQKGHGAESKRDIGSKEQFILLIDSKAPLRKIIQGAGSRVQNSEGSWERRPSPCRASLMIILLVKHQPHNFITS